MRIPRFPVNALPACLLAAIPRRSALFKRG